jgi:hypothetical protein
MISILIGSKRYSYELSLYWIMKVEKLWKHAPWRALNLVKKNGRLNQKEVPKNATSHKKNAQ